MQQQYQNPCNFNDTARVREPTRFDANSANDTFYPDTILRHRRCNSDSSFDQAHMVRHAASWTEPFDHEVDYYLPRDLLDEIDGDLPRKQPQPLQSLSNFETILTEQGVDQARTVINDLVSNQSDHKEKGKILRSAAEIAKRLSEVTLSLELYSNSTLHDPQTPASWIDRAKLLDELGDYSQAEEVLQEGIRVVQHCDQLIRKLLKSFERSNHLEQARSFLGSIYSNRSIDKETVLVEGGLFELRQGRIAQAMDILNYVHSQNGWKPNIYSEIIQYFERCGQIKSIYDIVLEGVRLNPRNAVICQSMLRNQEDPNIAIKTLKDSSSKWTSEFTDKMTTTVCESLAQHGFVKQMRRLISESLALCSPRQRYKLLLTAAIIELTKGDESIAPLILDLTLKITPLKSRSMILILIAKVNELNGDYSTALTFFERTVQEFSTEWRVYLELAQFHVHRNDINTAISVLTNALNQFKGSGRLWAFRVQLEAFNGVESQINILKAAIKAVPKSGEVWCEAARIALNPLTPYFNIGNAKQYLEFAYRFTPQHGDSLIESLRVEMLEKGPNADFNDIRKKFICSEGNYGILFVFIKKIDEKPMNEVFESAIAEVREDIQKNNKAYERAMARSSFVIRSHTEEEDRLRQIQQQESASMFAFGLTKVTKMVLDPSQCDPAEKLSIILGTSACGQ